MYRLSENIKPNLQTDGYWKSAKFTKTEVGLLEGLVKDNNIKSTTCFIESKQIHIIPHHPFLPWDEYIISVFTKKSIAKDEASQAYISWELDIDEEIELEDEYGDDLDSYDLEPIFQLRIRQYKQRLFGRIKNPHLFKGDLFWKIDKRTFYEISINEGEKFLCESRFWGEGVWTTFNEINREIKNTLDFVLPKILPSEIKITDRLIDKLKKSGDLKKVSKLLRYI